jgi:hypothetical protein
MKSLCCLTSCSPVVRLLVYQPSGPEFVSGHVSFRVSYYKGINPNDAAATFLIFVKYFLCYVLTCLQDSWPEIAVKGLEPVTFGSVFLSEATEGQ